MELAPGIRVRQEATDWQRALPYGLGAVVWDSALAFAALVDALERHLPELPERLEQSGPGDTGSRPAGFWRGRAVLELGAGCGAAGLAVAALGAQVTLTDREPVLPLLYRNARLNPELLVSVRSLDWEDAEAADFFVAQGRGMEPNAGIHQPFDVVIGTDVVDVDPDRRPGDTPFSALGWTLGTMLDAAPQCLGLLVFEERGPLNLEALGSLFAPLATRGELWEYVPPPRLRIAAASTANRLRYLCLQGAPAQEPSEGEAAGAFAGWRELLGAEADFRRWQGHDFGSE